MTPARQARGGRSLPPVAVAIGFINCINRGDMEGLAALMSADHRLEVFDEAPVTGRDANVVAWRGYVEAFPTYVIYPRRISQSGDDVVAVLGSTTGSHLGLPDDEERKLTLIWLAHVRDGLVERWRLVEDSAANRRTFLLEDR